jgi:hypothetical protein
MPTPLLLVSSTSRSTSPPQREAVRREWLKLGTAFLRNQKAVKSEWESVLIGLKAFPDPEMSEIAQRVEAMAALVENNTKRLFNKR